MAKIIMAWSKCKIEIGQTGANDTMAETLTDIGVILNQSSSLEAEAGDTLQAIATGGEVVAEEAQEGTLRLETTLIEPSENLARVQQFVNRWRKQKPEIPVEFYDERFTSVLAHRAMLEGGLKKKARQDKALVDEISATIILEDYMRSKQK